MNREHYHVNILLLFCFLNVLFQVLDIFCCTVVCIQEIDARLERAGCPEIVVIRETALVRSQK